jgi:hypothetical protein
MHPLGICIYFLIQHRHNQVCSAHLELRVYSKLRSVKHPFVWGCIKTYGGFNIMYLDLEVYRKGGYGACLKWGCIDIEDRGACFGSGMY